MNYKIDWPAYEAWYRETNKGALWMAGPDGAIEYLGGPDEEGYIEFHQRRGKSPVPVHLSVPKEFVTIEGEE